MAYVDTSLIVSALSNERATPKAKAWLTAVRADQIFISDWTITELSSAFAMKLRTGQIDLAQRAVALAAFNQLIATSLIVLPITVAHFQTAAGFADQHALGLRAGDALHLAIAASHGLAVYTLDRGLCGAGPALGVPTELVA